MKFRLLFITLFICSFAFAQKGTVSGVLTDKDANNATLPFANAMIKGTNVGTTTDENGKYSFKVDAGNYTIIFSFLGYENVEQNFTIAAGENVTINKGLGSGSYKLEDVVIQATAKSREKETALLLDQKNAVEIKQNIGAQELSRKGVSDVATAISKTTGVTKEEGSGNIFVRGLGDRYNATTMNGLPIPSNDPEKKNMNLENFSTDIIEYISIDKVYSSRLFGDFGGGNVDIISKNYQGKGFFRVEIGTNANTNAIGDKNFKLQKGQDDFGFSDHGIPNNPLRQYNFRTLEKEHKVPFAGNLGLSAGDSYNIGESGKLSLFGTVSLTNEYASKNNASAASSVNPAATGSGNEIGFYGKKFYKYLSYTYGTNTTAMGNIGYKINNNHKVSFNTLFMNSSSQSSEEYYGRDVDANAEEGNGITVRNLYTKNTLFVNQLLGEHKLTDRIVANWGVSHNVIDGEMPDRTTNKLTTNEGKYYVAGQSAADNNHYFQGLTETETAVSAAVDYKIGKTGEGEFKGKITLGYNGKVKARDFQATQFNVKSGNAEIDFNNPDSFYNQQNLAAGLINISTFRGETGIKGALNPQFYTGDQTISSGFANFEYKFGAKFTASLGVRTDRITQDVTWNTSLDPKTRGNNLNKNAFMPNVILKYELNDKQNLRFGFSQTYTLPQFKERALFVYEDINEVHVGNPRLYASDNYNADIKWEMFPKSEELISVTAFGKYIQNPINETTINSATNDISYVNSGDSGYAVGAEVEYRKSIFNIGENNARKLSAGLNASYIYTDQELDSEKVKRETDYEVDFTNTKGKFTGASPLLLNADLTYLQEWNNKDSNISATIAYNYFSDRVYALGTTQRGNQIDEAVGTLDFILKSKFNKNLGLGLAIKNILDPTINRVQANAGGDVNMLSYTKGLNLSLGLNYQF
ncbi:TonB-dependent receptor [Flavobacterium noncentrifugens]|nr:TonB-dependent receptor [Flavobacterium noncentrifugens]